MKNYEIDNFIYEGSILIKLLYFKNENVDFFQTMIRLIMN